MMMLCIPSASSVTDPSMAGRGAQRCTTTTTSHCSTHLLPSVHFKLTSSITTKLPSQITPPIHLSSPSVLVEYLGYEEDTRCILSRHDLHPVPHKRSRYGYGYWYGYWYCTTPFITVKLFIPVTYLHLPLAHITHSLTHSFTLSIVLRSELLQPITRPPVTLLTSQIPYHPPTFTFTH